MLLPLNAVIFAFTAILLSFSRTSLARPSMNTISNNLDTRSPQDQQCDSLCSLNHATDTAKCGQWHRPTSRLFQACTNTVDNKRNECRTKCGTNTIQFQGCIQVRRHQLSVQLKPCDTSIRPLSDCALSALIRGDECESQCKIQYEIQSKTADDRNVCYSLAIDIISRSKKNCKQMSSGYMAYGCIHTCMGSVHVSTEYCDNNFPVDDQGNPVKVHPKVPELPSCWK